MNLSFTRKTLDTVLETCQRGTDPSFPTDVPSVYSKMS